MFSGVFSSNIIGLNPSTKYFIRAYATNNAGTVYGEAKSFTTLADQEKLEIQNYRNDNPTLSFQLKPSGLYYLDLIIGTGPVPVAHDTAYVQYTGKFLNGNVFDTNIGGADLVFPVVEGWLISGFDEGITYMREGGKALFLMPSKLAYGSAGYYSIPGYTPLLFEVDLVKVKKR
jgi:FKBP-type peptidyl-prolyl cis-trans isomerase